MKYTLYTMLALFINTCPAMAQGKKADSTANTVGLGEIVVSANKTEETKKVLAQQVQVLDRQQIANANAQTTADLLANTAGVFVQKSQMGGGSPVLRGFEANKVLLVIDGVRMNNIIYRGGHLQNVITIDNSMLERAEILYGPSSTVYGSDALGGVMHFYTRNPLFSEEKGKTKFGVNAYTRYGSVNNEMTGHADFNIGGKKLASLTSITYSSFGDLMGGKSQNPFYDTTYGERPFYVDRINGVDSLVANGDKYKQVNTAYTQYDFMQKFAYQQNDHTTHILNIQYSGSADIPRYDRLTDPAGSGLKYGDWYYGPQKRAMVVYSINNTNASSFFQKKHTSVSYQDIEESRHNRNFKSNNLAHRVEKVGVFGVNIDWQREAGPHNFRVGFEGQSNTLKSTAERENIATGAVTPIDTRYPDGNNMMNNTSLYGSHTWRINDKFTLNDGLRLGFVNLLSTFNDTSFFHLPFTEAKQNNFVYSGNVGLVHTVNDGLKLSLLVSTGFRTPNVDDLAKVFESAPGSLIIPNNKLRAEKTVNTELGVTKVFGNKTIWENALYYTSYFDAIVTAPTKYTNGQDSVLYNGTMSRVLSSQNLGKAYIYGFTSSVRSQVSKNIMLSAGLNYTYGRIATDSTDKPLDHIPPVQLRLQGTYTKDKLGVDFFVIYQGAKELKDYYLNGEDNEQYATADGMPAWMTANLRVSYKVHKYITVQAGVDNIMDTQYRVFSSGINGPGRNIFGVVRFHY